MIHNFLKNHKIINKFFKTNCFNIHHFSNGSFWDSKLHNKIQKVEADPNFWKPNKKLFQLTPQKEYIGSRYSSGTDSSGGFWQSKLFNKIKK